MKTCKVCNTEYVPDEHTRMLLCHPCLLKYRRDRHAVHPRKVYVIGQERTCTTCSNTFEHHGAGRSICKPCSRVYNKKWYSTISDKQRAHANLEWKKRREAMFERFNIWKAERGCCRCDENDPVCLDLHHLDPTTKDKGISSIVGRRTWDRIMEEAAKCIVICANCHRKLHAKLRRKKKHHAGVAQG